MSPPSAAASGGFPVGDVPLGPTDASLAVRATRSATAAAAAVAAAPPAAAAAAPAAASSSSSPPGRLPGRVRRGERMNPKP